MKVAIDLQEGFVNDEVVIYNGQKEIFRAAGVKSKTQIGYAATVEADLTGTKANLRVELPARGISEEKEIKLSPNLHIAVSFNEMENKLEWKTSEAPFMYM